MIDLAFLAHYLIVVLNVWFRDHNPIIMLEDVSDISSASYALDPTWFALVITVLKLSNDRRKVSILAAFPSILTSLVYLCTKVTQ